MKQKKIISGLMALFYFISLPIWASSIGYEDNPSNITTTFKGFYSPVSKEIIAKRPYGGYLCEVSPDSTSNGFISASAKWRNPNRAGYIIVGNDTYEIQRTNVPGVGIIAKMIGVFENASNSPEVTIGSDYKLISQVMSTPQQSVQFGGKYWALVSLPREPFIPGQYELDTSLTTVDVWCHAKDPSNDVHGGGFATGTITINAPTCYLGPEVSSIIDMNLGQHSWSSIRNLNVGSNFGSATKNLSMTCESGSWPKITVTDKNNASNSSNIISLSNPTASSTAQGIGVQLFLNHQAVAQQLTKAFNLTASKLTQDQTIELPLEFKYIKTGERISTGEANAIVDLTFTYD